MTATSAARREPRGEGTAVAATPHVGTLAVVRLAAAQAGLALLGLLRHRDQMLPGTWPPTQRRSASTGKVLMTRSSGTPISAARLQPFGCHSSCPVLCASLSMENQQLC